MQFFEIIKQDESSRARMGILRTGHGDIHTPAFLPQAATILTRVINPRELSFWGAEAAFVSTYHLAAKLGEKIISKSGGLHAFLGLPGPLFTDSGAPCARGFGTLGFDLNPKNITVTGKGIAYQAGDNRQIKTITPESSIESQIGFGSDIVQYLHFMPSSSSAIKNKIWRRVTADWGKRARRSFEKTIRGRPEPEIPKVFGCVSPVLSEKDLRTQVLDLVALNVDGCSVRLSEKISVKSLKSSINKISSVLPPNLPLHISGLSQAWQFAAAIAQGADLFDSLSPNEFAFRGELFLTKSGGRKGHVLDIKKSVYKKDAAPIDSVCDCYYCLHHSRSELHALFASSDSAGFRFASMHNLRFVLNRFAQIRRAIEYGSFSEFF